MKITEEDQILIEMYLDNAISPTDLLSFEKRLKEEEHLASALTKQSEIHRFLRNREDRNDLKSMLEKQTIPQGKKPTKVIPFYASNWTKLAIGVAAIFLIVMVWQPWVSPDVYQQFAQHKPLSLTERGTQNNLAELEQTFNGKDYEQSAAFLKIYVAKSPEDIKAQLYLGISYLELGDYEQAEILLQKIAKGQSVFKEEAIWYSALSNIKQGNNTEALRSLEKLSKDGPYTQKAKELKSLID